MNRRNFLQFAALAIAGQAAERVWPFRVYSIPKKIVAPEKIVGVDYGFTSPAMYSWDSSTRTLRCIRHAELTPEIARIAQRQIMQRLGVRKYETDEFLDGLQYAINS